MSHDPLPPARKQRPRVPDAAVDTAIEAIRGGATLEEAAASIGLTGLPDTEQTDQYREAADALAARRAMLQAQLIALQAERLALRER